MNFLQKSLKDNNLIVKVEYYCNNCNHYFEVDRLGVENPTCSYFDSDNGSDF